MGVGIDTADSFKLGSNAQFAIGCKFGPGSKFAPGCIFGHVNGVLRICTGCNYKPGCKVTPTFEVEQIYLHPDANCTFERKNVFSIRFDRRF